MGDKIKAVIRTPQRMTAAIGGRDTTPAKWKGEWQAEETYAALQKVSRAGSSYVCIKACVGVDPALDVGEGVEGECWLLIAKRGDQGAPFTFDMFTAAQLAALKGAQGVGIEKIEQTGAGGTTVPDEYGSLVTVGRWTDYRITFTDGGFFDYRVEGGADGPRGLRGAAFTYSDFTEEQLAALKGRPFTYEDFTPAQLAALRGPAGETITDISRTSGTGAPGTVDTYTVTTSTGRTWPLYLYNGKDGQGAGDMTAAVYDPTGKKTDVFSYVDQKVANIPTPDVSGQIGSHNTDGTAHNDIRGLITGLTTRLNALADSDDITLDQMSELVAYIKSNKSLIDAITTAKVNVSDIVNDLVTNNANKPLSAAQGVALKALIEQAAASVGAHNQSAGTITAGTFAGQVVANSSGQTPGTKLIRNSKLMAATAFDAVTDWSSHITNGEIVWRYE